MEHYIWLGIMVITILWYCVVTVVVAIRGGRDIRSMINTFRRKDKDLTNRK